MQQHETGRNTVHPDDLVPESRRSKGGPPPSVVCFGAHADDEANIAPLLGDLCVDRGWRGTLVFATTSHLPETGESYEPHARRVADLFGARPVLWDLGDLGRWKPYPGDVERTIRSWTARAGSVEALLAMARGVIRDAGADLVFTHDPRHGDYGHPEHRVLGMLVVAAVQGMGEDAPQVNLFQSMAPSMWDGEFRWPGPKVPQDDAVLAYDATVRLESIGGPASLWWFRVLEQYPEDHPLPDEPALELLARASDEAQRVRYLPLADVVDSDPRYEGLCPGSTYRFSLASPLPNMSGTS
jgi:LmbE family N-acetylglucosaminyl deacetylase